MHISDYILIMIMYSLSSLSLSLLKMILNKIHTNSCLTYNPGKSNKEHHTPNIKHASYLGFKEKLLH